MAVPIQTRESRLLRLPLHRSRVVPPLSSAGVRLLSMANDAATFKTHATSEMDHAVADSPDAAKNLPRR